MSLDQRRLDKLVRRLRKLSEAKSASKLNEKKTERCLLQLQSMRLSVEQLQLSGLAAIVNRLRKLLRSDPALKTARRLIKDWQLAVDEAQRAAGDQRAENPKAARDQRAENPKAAGDQRVENPKAAGDQTAENPKAAKRKRPTQPIAPTVAEAALEEAAANPSVHHQCTDADTTGAAVESGQQLMTDADETSDPIRIKCREILQQPLEQAQTPTDAAAAAASSCAASPHRLATDIESSVFADFGSSADAKYKSRIRSLVMNLRDPKNPGLRHCLLRGALAAADFARMTSEQMASDEMKRLREKLAKDSIRVLQAASKPVEAGSSLFACKRCRKKNCTYSQLQTLSGDEPMTTYVVCNECGFRWKFN